MICWMTQLPNSKNIQRKKAVPKKNKVERYLGDGCEDPNDFKLDILG